MKRNMKFLLLLAIFTSSIMAAYFITGCGDDSTVIEFPPPVTNDTTVVIVQEDKVIGTIQGTVRDGYDNAFLAGVTIVWTNGDSAYSTTTDAGGNWSTPTDLPSGTYEFTLTLADPAHAVTSGFATIPDLEDLRGDDQNVPGGDIYHTEALLVRMLPMTARITGKVYTALPVAGKDQSDPMSLDDPTLVAALQGVTVILEYGDAFDIHPDIYTATTGADGSYSFDNVPLVFSTGDPWWCIAPKDGPPEMALADPGEVDVEIQPFQPGPDTSYAGWTLRDIDMVAPPGQAVMPTVFVAVAGSGNDADTTHNPVVLIYNFENPGFMVNDDLEFLFSKAMDPTTLNIDFELNGHDVDFADSVSADGYKLFLNPALSLLPDEDYDIEISGKAVGGLDLWDSQNNILNDFLWDRVLTTQLGMRFVATNLDDYGDDNNPFKDFPLDGSITIEFDMDVDLDNANGYVTLLDASNNREVNATVSASGVTVTVNPTDSLKSNSTYELDFNIYSALRGDFVDDDEVKDPKLTFTSFDNTTETLMPTGFAINMGTNWKADFDDLVINFKWDSVSGAEYYQIFAKDNRLNTDFIVVNDSIDDISFWTMQGGTVNFAFEMHIDTLPYPPYTIDTTYTYPNLSFDLYFDDTIQTPFSGGTEITFKVRAVNSAGPSPFSAEITIADETAPTYTVIQTGTADNTAGTDAATFTVAITEDEYLSTIAFAFAEASAVMGGDPAYVLTPADVAWTWEVDMRHGSGVVTVPIGACASADSIIVSITDNSGNVGRTAIDLRPYIIFTDPIAATTDFEAANPDVAWDIYDLDVGPVITGNLDLFWSYNGGTDWLDTTLAWKAYDASPTTWTAFDTVFSPTFMLGLGDNDGGWMWTSDVFNYNGLMLTGPDEDWLLDTIIYDEEGTDSTGIPLTWDFAGLDSVGIWYREDHGGGFGAWILNDSLDVTVSPGSYTWYPPVLGFNYTCSVKVADLDENPNPRPMHVLNWDFAVIYDYVNITAPLAGAMVAGGSDYPVTWTTVATATSEVGLSYVIGDDTTLIVSSTDNDGSYTWATPANTFSDDDAYFLIYDRLGNVILDDEGSFSISGIVVDAPLADVEWLVGSSYNLEWTEHGTVGEIEIYWSRDGFVLDSSLVAPADAGNSPLNWTVPANSACATVTFRIFGKTATDTVYITSEEMIFSGIVVTSPVAGNLAQGASTTITWETIGTLVGDEVDIDYMYITTGPPIFTSNWIELAGVEDNDGSWTWADIPAPPAEQAMVRIEQAGTGLGSDQGADFSISGVVLIDKFAGDVWSVGSANVIHWNEINTADVGDVTIALYEVTGATFVQNLQTGVSDTDWTWTIPSGFPASDEYYIRIHSENIPSIFDVSGTFEVLATITIVAPNSGETWTLGTGEDITWTHTGLAVDIKLMYTINDVDWFDIVGAGAITSVAGLNTFAWGLDPGVDGDLVAGTSCKVRAETVAGPLIFDESDAVFEILPAIALTAPVGGETWTLGTASDIIWTHIGVLGNVKLQYSIDGGAWTDIVGATNLDPDAGTPFSWTLDPATDAGLAATTACQVRVMTLAAPLVSNTSADFDILPSITVTAPAGGDTWNLDTPEDITWTHMGLLNNVKIEYTLDSGADPIVWFDIVTADAIPPGTLLFNWTLDETIDTDLAGANSGTCQVRVTAVSGPATSDATEDFTIAPALP